MTTYKSPIRTGLLLIRMERLGAIGVRTRCGSPVGSDPIHCRVHETKEHYVTAHEQARSNEFRVELPQGPSIFMDVHKNAFTHKRRGVFIHHCNVDNLALLYINLSLTSHITSLYNGCGARRTMAHGQMAGAGRESKV